MTHRATQAPSIGWKRRAMLPVDAREAAVSQGGNDSLRTELKAACPTACSLSFRGN